MESAGFTIPTPALLAKVVSSNQVAGEMMPLRLLPGPSLSRLVEDSFPS
jgi:hypothetical protein